MARRQKGGSGSNSLVCGKNMARRQKGGSGSNSRQRSSAPKQIGEEAKGNDPKLRHHHNSTTAPTNDLAGYTVLILFTTISYFPIFSAGFVWDDVIFAEAPQVKNPWGIYDIWFRPHTMQEIHYWPMTYTSFWLEYRLWGLSPSGYHATNVALHVVNACLVRNVLRRMGLRDEATWLAALVFATHPLNVESVAWAIERKDVLSGVFYLSSLLMHPNIDVAGPPEPGPDTNWLCRISLVLYVLGMLSKTIVVSLPAVLLLVPWLLRGRTTLAEMRNSELFFAVGVALAAFDVRLARAGEPIHFDFSLTERVLIASRAFSFYASKIIRPGTQMIIYPRWDLREDLGTWYLCFVVPLVLLVGLFIFRGRLGRGPLAAMLFFGGTLAPTLGLIDFGFMEYSFVAERFQYLASLGPISCLSAAVVRFSGDRDGPRWLPVAATTMIVIALLGSRTWHQVSIYHDNKTFWSYIAGVNPNAKAANLNLGNEYLRQKRHAEALPYFERSIEREPAQTKAYVNYGISLSSLGRHEESIRPLEKAIAIDPRSTKALNALGNSLSATKRYAESVKVFRAALQIDGNYAIGWGNMGNDLLRMGKPEDAVIAYQTAIKIRPHYTKIRIHLGIALSDLGRHDEAVGQFRKVLSYDPGNSSAKQHLARALGRVKEH